MTLGVPPICCRLGTTVGSAMRMRAFAHALPLARNGWDCPDCAPIAADAAIVDDRVTTCGGAQRGEGCFIEVTI